MQKWVVEAGSELDLGLLSRYFSRVAPLLPLCSQAAVSHSKLDWIVMECDKNPEYSEWTAYISFFHLSEDFLPAQSSYK